MNAQAEPYPGDDEQKRFKDFLIRGIRSKGMSREELIEALADSHLKLERVIRESRSSVRKLVSLGLAYSERTVSQIDGIEAEAEKMHVAAQQVLSGIDAYAASALLQGFEAGVKKAPTENAHKRHAEHRAMKADVFKWLDENFASCKSMDAAAEAMAGKLVPATFRTVRDYVTEWKKLRSASTP